ncbi:MAG: xanthine dehydrogenase family protein molybdopterin-binding subunit [Chitinophagaceae bacterium]|nr:xanthine dehydrogenase family protein molybdopterin-binding subunit [Rubrivivax sp.]
MSAPHGTLAAPREDPELHRSRRRFLQQSAAAGASLVVPLSLFGADDPARVARRAALTPWIVISPDDVVTVYLSQSEMGQGIYTGVAQVLADELEADWSTIRVELSAPVGPAYRITIIDYTGQFTGGSSSMTLLFSPLRKAGAAAREMLVEAAATAWQVPASQCEARNGAVLHRPSGRQQRYGVLASAASRLPVPASPSLKTPAQWRYIGRPMHRLDAGPKVDGSAVFGIDVEVPGMLIATVKHCPEVGGKIIAFNEAAVKAMEGVKGLIPMQGDAVIVVADSWWHALKAVTALEITVQAPPPSERVSSAVVKAQMRDRLAGGSGLVARNDGANLPVSGRELLAQTYELPYLAHATLEPPCATVHVRADGVTAWVPTQGQDVARQVLHEVLQLPLDSVTVHTTFIGGGFGRKFVPDFLIQAAIASKAMGAPVKLIWRREEDIQHDRYRPGSMVGMTGQLDANGAITALTARVAVQPLLGQIFAGWVRNGVDEASVEGLADTSYAIPRLRVEQLDVVAPIALGFLRSVGQSPNVFALESFIDELASSAGRDPLAVRRELLRYDERGLAVLNAVATMSAWAAARARLGRVGRALGIAYRGYVGRGGSFITRVAEVAEVSVTEGRLRVHTVWCAVDCGTVINPDSVRAQVEGAIGFGLSAALHGKISFKDGRVEQANYDDYPMLKLSDMPDVRIQIMRNAHPPSGIGEPAMPPLAPAVCNAIFSLTGRRIRSLPLSDHGLI